MGNMRHRFERFWSPCRHARWVWLVVGSVIGLTSTPLHAQDITQEQWARTLARELGWMDALGDNPSSEDVTWMLTGRDRIPLAATSAQQTAKDAKATTYQFNFKVKRPGAYLVKAKLTGGPSFVTVDDRPSVLVKKTSGTRWLDSGTFPLSKGDHVVSVTIPSGSPPAVELLSGCSIIAPPGGWKPNQTLDYGAKTATMVRALRIQDRLPAGTRFDIPGTSARRTLRVTQEGEFNIEVQTPAGSPVFFRLDGCYEQLASASKASEWSNAATATLTPGEHAITLVGSPQVINDTKVRLVSRRASPGDFVAAIQQLGVKEGAANEAVTRKAADANLSHPMVRSLLEGLGLVKKTPQGGRRAAVELPTEHVPAAWKSPASPVLPAPPQEDPE